MKTGLICLGVIGMACLFLSPLAFSQGEADMTAQEKPAGNNISWVWGEIKALDPVASALTVNYMDYQNETEKELIVSVDQDTIFENIGGLSEIKAGDTASIDYMEKDGKNIAKTISIEKMEEMPEAPASVGLESKDAPEISTGIEGIDTKEENQKAVPGGQE